MKPVEHSASGAWVTTVDGRRLLNCGGYGVLTFGAAHPVVVRHLKAQLERLPFGSRSLAHDRSEDAARSFRSVLPEPLSEVVFATTGAEAVELALRLARLNRCTRFVAMDGGFHGRTLGTLSINGSERLRRPYLPLLDGVEFVPFGDSGELDRALATSAARTAVVVEPVQGEAGVRIPPPGYLTAVADACSRHGALLIVDEVQTGLGRLGYRWGVDRSEVVPDILVAGKALGGGVVPVSAIAARGSVFRPFQRDPRHTHATFSGFPLGAAAVVAAVEVFETEDIAGRAKRIEPQVQEILRQAAAITGERCAETRGLGILHGIEFAHPRDAAQFADSLIAEDVVPSYSLGSSTTVRLTPPALLEAADLTFLRRAVLAAAEATAAAPALS
jgi:putrescine aminotransferase